MKYYSKKLLRLMVFASIVGFVVTSIVLIFVFAHETVKSYDKSLKNLQIQNNKKARISAQDKINSIVSLTNIYKDSLYEQSKLNVQSKVKDALDIIRNIYTSNPTLAKNEIIKKIKHRLRDTRFFANKTGYYFIYTLKGKCILLPTAPSLEGTNQINFLDGKKEHTIQKAIRIVEAKNGDFATWWWYKIGEKKMKEKIGYVEIFKPLGIFVGTAVYKEDILKEIKTRVIEYLQKLEPDKYGYIFAYDFSGNQMLKKKKLIVKINQWYDTTEEKRFVADAIRGARIIPEGFFMDYLSKQNKIEFSYVRLMPDMNMVLGRKVKDTKEVYKKQKKYLENEIDNIIRNTIFIALLLFVFISFVFMLLYKKIKRLFIKLEHKIVAKTQELENQKYLLQKLFDNALYGIFLSQDKKNIDCNKMVLDIFETKNKEDFLRLATKDYFPKRQSDGRNSIEVLEEKSKPARVGSVADFEIEAITRKGKKIWINVFATSIKIQDESIGYFSFRDITHRKKIEQDLEIQREKFKFQAKHDALTALPNRIFLTDRLHQSMKRADRNGKYLGVVFLDLDNFKTVNDVFGHDIGDLLLVEVAFILRNFVRTTDTVSRFGGDEFVLVIDELESVDDCSVILQKIIARFQEPFILQNTPLEVTFSMGVSIYPNDAKDEQSLLKFADIAMYRAKDSGKNRYVYYDKSMNSDMLEHIKLEQDIKRGIKNDEFVLHFQPQFEVGSQRVVGFEALVRWQHPKLGLKYPDYFIQTAENSNLIISLGEAISKKAIAQISLWYKEGLNPGTMSINFTSRQLESENFFNILANIMREHNCKPEWVEGELIERYIMSDTDKTTQMLKCFKDIGVSVSIDDFGTGYSSLGYLKYLEISKLKIDKIFVDDLQKDKRDRAIAKSIIDLSSGLGLKVIAEGVETKEQYEILQTLGCQIIQGYYFSKPISCDDAKNLLLKKQRETLRLPK